MESRAYAVAVGIFTLLLGMGLAFAYWWMSGSQQAQTEYTIESRLPVAGLNAEATVRFRGVDVGKVTRISIDPSVQSKILITITVAQNLKLSSHSYAELRLQGLTGLAYIDLNDEGKTAPELLAGGTIVLRPSMMDQLIAKGPQLVTQLEGFLQSGSQLTASANRVLNSIDTQKLNHTVENLNKASEQALPVLNSARIMLNNVSNVASQQNQVQLVHTLESIQQTADAARPLISDLTQTSKVFRNTANQIELSTNQLNNTLNTETLPNLQLLTQNMNRSVYHFDQLINGLEENPQSIIFGKPALLPGPGEEGFTNKP
ncbi:MAG: MlaD family protein [Methylophilaceae bacterium]